MFGIGAPELLVILAVALIVIGPKKLPDLARSLGKALGEFRRATNDLKQSIEQETGLDEIRKDFAGAGREAMASLKPDVAKSPLPASSPEARKEASEGDPAAAAAQPVGAVDDRAAGPGPDAQPDEESAQRDSTPGAEKAPSDDVQGKSAS